MSEQAERQGPKAIHGIHEECPKWCHLCPHMRGGVMPWCMSSVTSAIDENDLTACTCDDCDPIVAHIRVISHASMLLTLARDARRQRHYDRVDLQRLRDLSKLMKSSMDVRGQRAAWAEVESIAGRLGAQGVLAALQHTEGTTP